MQNRSWENNIRRAEPYIPGEQPGSADVIKLNTNENPYPPSLKVKKAVENFNYQRLSLYPDPDSKKLTDAIAGYHRVDSSQVFVGVGSDDVLSMAFLTFFNSDKPVLFPEITYSFYEVWAAVYGIPFKKVPLGNGFKIDPDGFAEHNGGVIFPNPNAPTGVLESLDTVEKIIKSNADSVVIIDEAYIDFGGQSALALLDKYENLLVVRTFSKSRSAAGARIGYAVGNKRLIRCLNDVKFSVNSYTMNSLSQVIGEASVKDDDYFKETTKRIILTRERTKKQLAKLGFSFPDSKANFIFASHESVYAGELFEELKKRNILVRYWNKPGIDNYLRITIGTDEEMDKLILALKDILNV